MYRKRGQKWETGASASGVAKPHDRASCDVPVGEPYPHWFRDGALPAQHAGARGGVAPPADYKSIWADCAISGSFVPRITAVTVHACQI